jgi:Leucine-rich repeat (LRR) protein
MTKNCGKTVLRKLILSNCELQDVTNELLESCKDSLTHLDLSDNPALSFLGENIGLLTQLVHLDLGVYLPRPIEEGEEKHPPTLIKGALSKLPKTIRKLKRLAFFSARGLSIRRIPRGLSKLALLQQIDFSRNNLLLVNMNYFAEMPYLKLLNLSGNERLEVESQKCHGFSADAPQ